MADGFSTPGIYVTPPQGVEEYSDPLQRAARDTLLSPVATTGMGSLASSTADTAVTGQAPTPFTTGATLERPAAGLAPPPQAPFSAYSATPLPTFAAPTPRAAPAETGPQVAYNAATKQFYVGGNLINAANALEVEEGSKLLGQPGRPLPSTASGWQPIDPSSYMTYLESLKKPRTVREDIALGAQSLAAGTIAGVGRAAQMLGATEAGPAIAKFAEERVGPSKEEQARTALINQSNSFLQNVLDAAAQGSSSVAASLIGGVGGFLVGGPLGAAVGAGLTSFLPNISALWDSAQKNNYNVNDSNIQLQIVGGALGLSALDAIPVGRGAKVFSPALKEAAEAAGQTVVRRMLTGARRSSLEEAATEATQELLQNTWFDPKARALLSQGDLATLAPYVAQTYGREALVAGGAGAILGGIFGGGAAALGGRAGVDTGEPKNLLADAGAKEEAPAAGVTPTAGLPAPEPVLALPAPAPTPTAAPQPIPADIFAGPAAQVTPEQYLAGTAPPALPTPPTAVVTQEVTTPPLTNQELPRSKIEKRKLADTYFNSLPDDQRAAVIATYGEDIGVTDPVAAREAFAKFIRGEKLSVVSEQLPALITRATRAVDLGIPASTPEVPLAPPPPPASTVQTPTEIVAAATQTGEPISAAPVTPSPEVGPVAVSPAAAVPVVETTPAAPVEPAAPVLTLAQRKAAILAAYDALDTAAQKKAFRKAVIGRDYDALIFRDRVNNATNASIADIETKANAFAAELTAQATQQEVTPAEAPAPTEAAPKPAAPETKAAPEKKAPAARKKTFRVSAVKPEAQEARAPQAPAPAVQPTETIVETQTAGIVNKPGLTSAGTLVRAVGQIENKFVDFTRALVDMTGLRARDVAILYRSKIGLVRDTILPETEDDAYVVTTNVNGRPTHFVVLNDSKKFSLRKTLELIAHEVGHIVEKDGFATASARVRNAITSDWNKHVARYGNRTVREFVRSTFPTERAIGWISDSDPDVLNQTLNEVSTTDPDLYSYLAGAEGFSEWFANQTARWATTSKKPLTIVEKFFAELGRMLRKVYDGLVSQSADDGLPVESMRKFLDSLSPPLLEPTTPPPLPKGAAQVQTARAAAQAAAPEPTPNTPDKIIGFADQYLPRQVAGASADIAINLLELGKRGVYGMSFGTDLIKQVKSILPSAENFFDVLTRGASVTREMGEARNAIFNDIATLPKAQRLEIFSVGLKQTTRGKWGYEPAWLKGKLDRKGEPVKIEIDPTAKAEWDKLKAANPKGAVILDRMFEHMYMLDQNLRTTVRNIVEADLSTEEFNALSPEDKAKRRAEVQNRLKVLDVYGRINGPYLPLTRFGSFIVVARSKALQTLEAIPVADRSKEEADQIAEMRRDPKHLTVEFYDSKAAATRARRDIAKAYPEMDVADFNKISEIKDFKDDVSRTLLTLRATIKDGIGDSAEAKKAEAILDDALMTLYVRGLAESSARRRKLPREGVSGVKPEEMHKGFDISSQSMSMFIDNLTKSTALAPIMEQLRQEAAVDGATLDALNADRPDGMKVTAPREERTRAMRELMLRYVEGVGQQPTSSIADSLSSFVSYYLLLTLPRYHIMNATQTAMMTQPRLAAQFGFAKSWGALGNAYQGLIQSIKSDDSGFFSGKFDITKLKAYDENTKKYVPLSGGALRAMEALRDRSLLDVGLGLELAHFRAYGLGETATGFNKVMRGLTNISRRVEYTNRVVAGLSAYNLKLEQLKRDNPGITAESAERQAIEYAVDIVRTTQGDPTSENAPRYFNKLGGAGKVILQFRKFQLLQASEIIRHAHTMFKGASPEERQIARAALGFLLLNTSVMAGAVGIPGVALASYILAAAFGDDEELKYSVGSYTTRGERALRSVLGDNAIANILIKGVPAGFGIDIGAQLGMGTTFSILPYTDLDLTSKEGYNKAVVGLLGPIGAIGSSFADGAGMMARGDYWKGTEMMLPTGFRAAMRAYRETFADGITTRGGDQLVSPEEFNLLKTVVNGLGITTTDMQKIRDTRRDIYDYDVYFKNRTSTLRRQFVEARKDRDYEAQEAIKAEWRELQAAKQRVGFKSTSLSSLLLAPTEQVKREKRGQEQFRRVQEAQ